MLTEERYAATLRILAEKKAVTVQELTKALDASESTVRRDLTALHRSGRLYKVYGGATSIDNNYSSNEEDMRTKREKHKEDKIIIARRAASLIRRGDFVYLDAGTTTLHMIDFITEPSAVFVTNGMPHALKLAERGFKTFILGGRMKDTTEAVIGTEALSMLSVYNFTRGFFGANGIRIDSGYSTPDAPEGLMKKTALQRCTHAYILADSSKFNKIYPITFASLPDATILTDRLEDKKYRDYTTILEGE